MNRALLSLPCGLIVLSLLFSCGKSEIDPAATAQNRPQLTEHRSQAAQVQQFIKDLKKTGNEKPDPPQAQMYISLLGKIGREAEPALPILKQIANDETAEAQTREYAKAAIEKIQNAIDD